MGNPRPNPFGNHCGTKHKVGKKTGGANRGQGRISNIEKAHVSRRIYEILSSKLPNAQSDVIYKGPDVCNLDVVKDAELYLGGRMVAKCTIIYVGQKGSLETRKWGKTTIGAGKMLVKIDEVWQRNTHPLLS